MNEADRVARDKARAAAAARAHAEQETAAQQAATAGAERVRELEALIAHVLPILRARRLDAVEEVSFRRKRLVGGYKSVSKGAWKIGQWYPHWYPSGSSLPPEPIWLFSDGKIGQPSQGAPTPVEPRDIIFGQVVGLAIEGLTQMRAELA